MAVTGSSRRARIRCQIGEGTNEVAVRSEKRPRAYQGCRLPLPKVPSWYEQTATLVCPVGENRSTAAQPSPVIACSLDRYRTLIRCWPRSCACIGLSYELYVVGQQKASVGQTSAHRARGPLAGFLCFDFCLGWERTVNNAL